MEYVRGLLVEQRVLPGRDRRVADFERWLRRRLDTVDDDEQRQLLERYGRRHHLRRLRGKAVAAPVTDAAFERAKQSVTVAGQFLSWLAAAELRLDDVRQAHVDQWYADGASTAEHVETFLYWCLEHRLLHGLTVPRRHHDSHVPLGEQQRLTALRRLLTEQDIDLQVRVLAGLVLLFGQPVNRLTRLSVHDVDLASGTIRIRLAAHWTDVPEPFTSLLRQHVTDRPNRSTAANARSDWLFPGRMPGQPLSPAFVTTLLTAAGVPALPARAATWRQLTRQAPPAVLAVARHLPRDRATPRRTRRQRLRPLPRSPRHRITLSTP